MTLPVDFAQRYGPWAVVTGSSSGIGYQFSLQLAAAGLSVVLVARRQERLDALSKHINENYPVQTKVIVADLMQEEGWRSVVSETADLDVGLLVNNAGVEVYGSFFHDTLEKHLALISLNVTAVTALAHQIGRRITDRGRGGIINVSSIASTPQPWMSTYAGSKSFVSTLSLVLRSELTPKGVDVLALEPGFTVSEMTDRGKHVVDTEKLGVQYVSSEQCVSEALVALTNNKDRTTPGFMNRFMFFLVNILPTWLTMHLFSKKIQDLSDPEVFKHLPLS